MVEQTISSRLTGFLTQSCQGGLWSYAVESEAATEPSALGLIALRTNPDLRKQIQKQIIQKQNLDGGWATDFKDKHSDWSTFITVLALQICLNMDQKNKENSQEQKQLSSAIEKARNYMLDSRAEYYSSIGKVLLWLWHGADYDYPRGFAWTPHTFDWVEPSSYAITSFKISGTSLGKVLIDSINMAEKYLLTTICPQGGWNFGERYSAGVPCPPDPLSTSLALIALQDQDNNQIIGRGLSYLKNNEQAKTSPTALSWSIIALDLWQQDYSHLKKQLLDNYGKTLYSSQKIIPAALASIALNLDKDGNPFRIPK